MFQTGVNEQMCTTFCKCPGAPGDYHYKEYKKIPAEEYAKFDRYFTFTPDPADSIEVTMDKQSKQLQWLPVDPDTSRLVTETMLECYENMADIAKAKSGDIDGLSLTP